VGFIERVLEEKRVELDRKKRDRPVETMRESLEATPVRDFRCAIASSTEGASYTPIIAELKARTPSVKSFVQSDSLDQLAQTYEANGAAAISIVTDTGNFGTSLDDVRSVRKRVSLPVLVKDFLIDRYQIFEARAYGADAVLLIVRLLDLDRLTELLGLVRQLGMSALLETHNEAEVAMALQARGTIVGVNNRNLDTLEVSLETTRRLAKLVPSDVTLVSESGIRERGDIEDLSAAGVNAFLVGGTLLNSEDPGGTLRSLRGQGAKVGRR
jgi:indole-3-glycerol phosphate synthase